MNMRRGIAWLLAIPGTFLIISVWLIFIPILFDKDSIMKYGIGMNSFLSICCLLIFSVPGVLLAAPLVKSIMRSRSERIIPALPEARPNRAFPIKKASTTRQQLVEIQAKRPKLGEEINRSLAQLGTVEQLLDNFDMLMQVNGIAAKPIEGAKAALNAIEETLCANFRWVINLSIAAGDLPEDTDHFYDQCRLRIRYALDANRTALDKGGDFLIALADNISQVAKQINSDRHSTLIDAWIKTIEDQNEQSTINFKEDSV